MPPINKNTPPQTANKVVNDVVRFDSTNRMVHVKKSLTKNLGDYNNAKVEIGITLPIDFTRADLAKANEAITACIQLVDERVEEEINAIENEQ